jgi:hypothetical protein
MVVVADVSGLVADVLLIAVCRIVIIGKLAVGIGSANSRNWLWW